MPSSFMNFLALGYTIVLRIAPGAIDGRLRLFRQHLSWPNLRNRSRRLTKDGWKGASEACHPPDFLKLILIPITKSERQKMRFFDKDARYADDHSGIMFSRADSARSGSARDERVESAACSTYTELS